MTQDVDYDAMRQRLIEDVKTVGSYLFHQGEDMIPRDMRGIKDDGISISIDLSADGLPVITFSCRAFVVPVRIHRDNEH